MSLSPRQNDAVTNRSENATDEVDVEVEDSEATAQHEDLPTTEEILNELRHDKAGRRGIVSDAYKVRGLTNNNVEVYHDAQDGEVIVQLRPMIMFVGGDGDPHSHYDDVLDKMTRYEV